jgi:hypothetical protein
MKSALAAVMAGVVMALAAPAKAAEPTTLDQDVSCLVVSLTLISSQDETTRENGLKAFLYWLGRVDGAAPTLDLETRIAEMAQAMTREDTSAELMRCGSVMVERGQEVQAIGGRLAERGL